MSIFDRLKDITDKVQEVAEAGAELAENASEEVRERMATLTQEATARIEEGVKEAESFQAAASQKVLDQMIKTLEENGYTVTK